MRHLRIFLFTLYGFFINGSCSVLLADDLFSDDVMPILQAKCLSCHNSTESKGDFALDTRDGLYESGFLVKGKPAESHLVDVITPDGSGMAKMPKGKEWCFSGSYRKCLDQNVTQLGCLKSGKI